MHQLLQRTLFVTALLSTPIVNAGFLDFIKDIDANKLALPTTTQLATNLSSTDVIAGLKQALEKGTHIAVTNLSADGGFLNNADVKVPIPNSLQAITSSLKMLGQGDLVDNFQTTLNRAAEQAAPEAAAIFSSSIQQMSIDDAVKILNGADDAATEYFKQHNAEKLLEKFLPIVKQATDTSGVTSSYKLLITHSGSLGDMLALQSTDLDTFVAQKAVDAMFIRIAEQEKLIRENPAARTTDLLKKVFTP